MADTLRELAQKVADYGWGTSVTEQYHNERMTAMNRLRAALSAPQGQEPTDPFAPVRCPDPACGKWTDPGDTCDHCGCPLTEEARAGLVDGLADVTKEVVPTETERGNEPVVSVTPPGVESGSASKGSAPLGVAEGHECAARTHHLKTWPEYFVKLLTGEKTFEYRNNDRDFGVGDTLVLEEWDPATKQYSGRSMTRQVSYMMLMIPDWYVVMALAQPRPAPLSRQKAEWMVVEAITGKSGYTRAALNVEFQHYCDRLIELLMSVAGSEDTALLDKLLHMLHSEKRFTHGNTWDGWEIGLRGEDYLRTGRDAIRAAIAQEKTR